MRSLCLAFAAAAALAAPVALAAEPLPVGKCINMGNSFEVSRTYTGSAKPIDAEDFARIAAAGFATVRVPVRWSDKTGDAPDHAIDPAWMARVETAVDQALAAGLNVILNDHHFDELHADPAANAAKLAAIWRQVAARFADRSTDRLWFEIENEPHARLNNDNLVATLAPALAAIRATNPDRPVVIGGGGWSGIDSLATLELPDDPNVHPTFHYYLPFDFTHQGASWAGPVPKAHTRDFGTPADAAQHAADVAKLEAYIARTGLTPFMGETGAYDGGTSLAERIEYHAAIRDAFAPTGIGICAWAYTNTFPFWDQATGQWLPGLRAAFGLPEN